MHMSVKYSGNKSFETLNGTITAIIDVYGK